MIVEQKLSKVLSKNYKILRNKNNLDLAIPHFRYCDPISYAEYYISNIAKLGAYQRDIWDPNCVWDTYIPGEDLPMHDNSFVENWREVTRKDLIELIEKREEFDDNLKNYLKINDSDKEEKKEMIKNQKEIRSIIEMKYGKDLFSYSLKGLKESYEDSGKTINDK